jgi:hypothetical protein
MRIDAQPISSLLCLVFNGLGSARFPLWAGYIQIEGECLRWKSSRGSQFATPRHGQFGVVPIAHTSPILPVPNAFVTYTMWISWHNKPQLFQELETVQDDALRKMIGARRTTRISSIQNEVALPPPGRQAGT